MERFYTLQPTRPTKEAILKYRLGLVDDCDELQKKGIKLERLLTYSQR